MNNRTEVVSRPLETVNVVLGTKRLLIQEGILVWAANHLPRCPWRQPGKSPYEVLIGELLLSEAPLAMAVEAYDDLVRLFVSVRSLSDASNNDLGEVLSRFDLQRHTDSIIALARRLAEQGKGNIPRDSECLLRFSGLEDHNIRAVMCFGYHLPVAIVSPHTARMLSRLFYDSLPSQPSQGLLRAIGEALLPGRGIQTYNCGFLDISESICTDKEPFCEKCPVGQVCDYVERYGR